MEQKPFAAMMFACAAVSSVLNSLLSLLLIRYCDRTIQVYRALRFWSTGVEERPKPARHGFFSEVNWGPSVDDGKWLLEIRDALDLLGENDWNDILTAAEDYRVSRLKGRKQSKAVVVKTEIEEEPTAGPSTEVVVQKPVKRVLVNRRKPDEVVGSGSGAQ